MKSAYLSKISSSLTISNKVSYETLKRGQVLVKICYTGVCKSQIFEIYGGRDNQRYIPHMLGHEATGVVLDKHKSVKKVKVGDRVILTWLKCDGLQSENPKYKDKNIIINSGSVTTFNSHSVVSENRLLKLPHNISFKNGVILGCAFPTGAGIILNQVKNKNNNKKIAFVGLGGVGVSSLLTALNFDFKEIYAFEKDRKKINFIKRNIKSKKKIIFKISNKENLNIYSNYFDYVIDTSGTTQGIEFGFKIQNYKGKLIFASHPHKNSKIKIDPFELIKGKKIYGSWGGGTNYEKISPMLFKHFRRIKNFDKIFNQKIYPFSKINSAINDLRFNRVLRPIIKI